MTDEEYKKVNACLCKADDISSLLYSLASMLNDYQFVKVNYGEKEAIERYGDRFKVAIDKCSKIDIELKDKCGFTLQRNIVEDIENAMKRSDKSIKEDWNGYIDLFHMYAGHTARWAIGQKCRRGRI